MLERKKTERHLIQENGYRWRPLATHKSGLICKLDILLLRNGKPGNALYDLDNRLKTLFDALRLARDLYELGKTDSTSAFAPNSNEDPFFVLLEDDSLITSISVNSADLLQPIPNIPQENAVRIYIDTTIQPYNVNMSNLDFA